MSLAQSNVLMQAKDLQMHFRGPRRGFMQARQAVRSVDGVNLNIATGRTLGLVGESGCGKSTTARMLMRMLEPTGGQIWFDHHDITHMDERQLRPLRTQFQLIAQDPYSSLNPRMKVERILDEPLRIAGLDADSRRERVQKAMAHISLSERYLNRYAHEFSGGQRQRIAIGRALVLQPRLLICDEPVSALDVSVQAQIINLLQDLQRDAGLTYLFVSHDLGVVKHIASDVAVMYLGRIVEIGDKQHVFAHPRHPYTQALMSAIPRTSGPNPDRIILQGELPTPLNPPSGCHFHTRCPYAQPRCRTEAPTLSDDAAGTHRVACHFPL